MGEKPLYWATAPDGSVIVASEIKGLLACGLVKPTIDPLAIDAYLALGYVPPDRTVYQNVHTLDPAARWPGTRGKSAAGNIGNQRIRTTTRWTRARR